MKTKHARPIVPAPVRDPGYPRATSVWSAFAAGVLTVAALPTRGGADCALPEHKGDAKASPVDAKATGKAKHAKVSERPIPMPGRVASVALPGEPAPVQQPLGGAPPPVQVLEGKPRAPDPVPPPKPKAPEDKKPARPKPNLDGDQAAVGEPVMHIHPHGPDEPCLLPDPSRGRLIIRFG